MGWIMESRLEHANFCVREIAKSVTFITTACPEFYIRGSDPEGAWVHVGTNDTYISLNRCPDGAFHRAYQDLGLNHIGIVVEDVDAVIARLESAGYHQNTGPEVTPWRKRYYFGDDDGQQWEFIEYMTDDPALKNKYE